MLCCLIGSHGLRKRPESGLIRIVYSARRARKYPPKRAFSKKCGNHLLSPRDYHRPYRLNYRVRNGNGCLPARIVTATAILAAASTESSRNRAKCGPSYVAATTSDPWQSPGALRGNTHRDSIRASFFPGDLRLRSSSRDSERCPWSCAHRLCVGRPTRELHAPEIVLATSGEHAAPFDVRVAGTSVSGIWVSQSVTADAAWISLNSMGCGGSASSMLGGR